MKKKYEFIKLFIKNSEKKYLFLGFELVVFCFLFHIVFYNVNEIKHLKQTLESIGSSELYRADYNLENVNNVNDKLNKLEEMLPQGIQVIAPSKGVAFTDQYYDHRQVTASFLSQNEVQQYRYNISKGEYFDKQRVQEGIYPAIIPEGLSGHYKLGEVYNIDIVKKFETIKSIKIEVIGSRKNNYILDTAYVSTNIFNRDATILVFDKYNEISPLFYIEYNGAVSVTLKNRGAYSENLFVSILEDYGLRNVESIEDRVLKINRLTYKDMYIYVMLLIVIVPLVIVSFASFHYLEFQNRKREYFIYVSTGLAPGFFFQSLLLLNIVVFIFPILLQELIWFLICRIKDLPYYWVHSLMILLIGILAATITSLFNTYFINKIKYEDKMLHKEISCE
ncbi:hypothetical protein [Paenibacillus bouchesdurhonensis]|uniref:hypothetical protein n=1 Tax=Paenibacillus bouchesdurhonensis TaxID=1870990 RepID=UPI000DA5F110|nr:hypothetical protein [Paenibacillus bouchesdurhonensis]